MTDIIKLLPDAVANQIAAGEVVQRPASVVKELLENAIDAEATHIRLLIKDGGRTLIQVIDNGKGMSETDARLSIERHATSKISSANDLFAIKSMGFRGEALASIAAIAHMEIKTRAHDQELGTQICVEASQVTSQKPTQTPKGTSVGVKNLFFNVPARRNFLKSRQVEMRHVLEEFNRVAIANPHIKMELHDDNTSRHQLPKGVLKQRIINLLGKNMEQKLVPVTVETALVTIRGFTGKPEFAKKTRGEQYFFVNNRYFKHPYFHHAVDNAYSQLLPEKSFPSYFIFFHIDPTRIDINIHPTKTEVNFADGQGIYAVLRSAVRKALGSHNLTPSLDFDREQSFDPRPSSSGRPIRSPEVKMTPGYNPFQTENTGAQPTATSTVRTVSTDNTLIPKDTEGERQNPYFLQLHGEYIASNIKSGLMLVHQQRAHERVLYEHFLQRLKDADGSSQRLIFPQTVTLSPADSELMEEVAPSLKNMGFQLKKVHPKKWEFEGCPANFNNENLQQMMESVLEDYKAQMMDAGMDRYSNLAKAMARKIAIKAGKTLKQEEMKSLIDSLFVCQMPEYSIDGKAVIQIVKTEELKEKFK